MLLLIFGSKSLNPKASHKTLISLQFYGQRVNKVNLHFIKKCCSAILT